MRPPAPALFGADDTDVKVLFLSAEPSTTQYHLTFRFSFKFLPPPAVREIASLGLVVMNFFQAFFLDETAVDDFPSSLTLPFCPSLTSALQFCYVVPVCLCREKPLWRICVLLDLMLQAPLPPSHRACWAC